RAGVEHIEREIGVGVGDRRVVHRRPSLRTSTPAAGADFRVPRPIGHTDPMAGGHDLAIGDLSRRTGVATSALRFYEEQGLIHAERTTGGQRRYHREVIRRVSFIRIAQQVGLSLGEIAAVIATLPDRRTPTRDDWHRVSATWCTRLDRQITLLERLRDELDGCIGCG